MPTYVREGKSKGPATLSPGEREAHPPSEQWALCPLEAQVNGGHLPASLLGLGFQELFDQLPLVSDLGNVTRNLSRWGIR